MILASMRDGGGGPPYLASVDLIQNTATRLPTLGVYQNKLSVANTVLSASPNGSTILIASADGHTMLYDANVNSFTVSRQDFPSLTGPYASSAFGQYVVGSALLNASLVPIATLTDPRRTLRFRFYSDRRLLHQFRVPANNPGVINGVGIRPPATLSKPPPRWNHRCSPAYRRPP